MKRKSSEMTTGKKRLCLGVCGKMLSGGKRICGPCQKRVDRMGITALRPRKSYAPGLKNLTDS